MATATKTEVVNLTLDMREARFVRTLLGALTPDDFSQDHPVMNLVRAKFPDYIELNSEVAMALLNLLGTGVGE